MTIKRIVEYNGVPTELEFESEDHFQRFTQARNNDEVSRSFFEGRKKIGHVTDDGILIPGEGANLAALTDQDPREARQSAKRAAHLEEVVKQALGPRPEAPGSNTETIQFETFAQLQRDYDQAIRSGESHDSALKRVGFQPSSVYLQKLTHYSDGRPRPRPVRPLFQHEVGIRPNGKIVVLYDKYPGDVGTLVVGAHKHKTKGGFGMGGDD